VTVSTNGVGRPFSSNGEYRHCFTASMAASSSNQTGRSTLTDLTRPVVSMGRRRRCGRGGDERHHLGRCRQYRREVHQRENDDDADDSIAPGALGWLLASKIAAYARAVIVVLAAELL